MPKVTYNKPKPTENKKTSISSADLKKQCTSCEKTFGKDKYYNSQNPLHADGKVPYCKNCVKRMILDDEGYIDLDRLQNALRSIDKPFIYSAWERALAEHKKSNKDPFGCYIKNLSLSRKNLTWSDSVFDRQNEEEIKEEQIESGNRDCIEQKKEQPDNKEFLRLEEKWGVGYKKDELLAFERKYEDLKNNYPEKTAMHTESLKTYVRYKTKEEFATAKNQISEAKQWGDLAFKAATNAKINPSQLSKADLSDGLSTFSELTQAVEAEVNVIKILPEFRAQPNDVIDFNLWCYINYIRHLKGLPECSYEEIYEFYDRNVEQYIKQYGDPNGIFEQDNTKKNREQVKTFLKDV